MKTFFHLVSLILLYSFLQPIEQARASIASMFGFGPKTMAMGATSLVHGSPSPFAAYTNPAQLGEITAVMVSVGGIYIDPRLRPFGTLVLNSNGTQGEFKDSGVVSGGGTSLGIAIPLGPRERPLTLGAAFYLPSGTMIRVSGSPVDYPFYPLYSDISKNMFFMVGAGYRVWGALHAGVNFSSTTESIAVYQLRADNTINYSASAVEARTKTKLSLALLYDFSKLEGNPRRLSVYTMYRAKSALETKLSADITAFVPIQGELNSTPSFSPSEYILGGSGNIGANTILNAEVSYIMWSEYSSPYGSGNINSYVIGTRQKSAGFKDVFVPRVGLEHKISLAKASIKTLSYRAGGFYYPTPVPNQTGDSNFVDSNRLALTTGAGLGIRNPWTKVEGSLLNFDAYFQWNRLAKRAVTKDLATNVGAPGYVSGGNIFVFGANATIEF